MSGLAPLFAAHGASNVRVSDLPLIADYPPDGGVGFVAEFAPGVSLFDILGLEIELEQHFDREVLVMDYLDQGFYFTDQMLEQAELLG